MEITGMGGLSSALDFGIIFLDVPNLWFGGLKKNYYFFKILT